jgi:pantetheine-phosphate adenylyltransferase
MKRIAVFPGSFDPITRGHESIIRRAIPLFDKIIVAIGINLEKSAYFTVDDRLKWIEKVFANQPKVSVKSYSGLTVDFCEQVHASYILRGLRTSADFEFERSVGQINLKLNPDIESVFLLTLPEFASLTSSIVREVHRYGGDVSQFIPDGIQL